MAESYLTLTNKVIARLNEVELTSSNFGSSRGIQTQCKHAVNEAIRFINQKEFNYPFNNTTATKTLTPGTVRYSLPSSTKTLDYNTFRLVKDSDINSVGGKLAILDYNEYVNNYITQEDEITTNNLNGSLNDSATTITVDSASSFDSTGTIYIENEQVTYTGTSSTTFTGCTRGANSTTAASHSDDVQVAQFNRGGRPQYVIRSPDNNYLLYPFPNKVYSVKFEYYTYPSDMSDHDDTTTIPDRFAAVIIDGATAFVYQYRGETAQYQLNMERFEQGIKNMQTLLINRFEYIRSTYIPRVSGNSITTISRAL
jgi:hypothetical protein